MLRRHGMDDIYTVKGLNNNNALWLFSWRAFNKPYPDRNIVNILQICFDCLMDTQKDLFLGIACFFKGENKDCVIDILESFGYYPIYNIDVLMDKSLIIINREGTLLMHDLLQEMGQEIVRRESPEEPGRRSRLWLCEDVLHILRNDTVSCLF